MVGEEEDGDKESAGGETWGAGGSEVDLRADFCGWSRGSAGTFRALRGSTSFSAEADGGDEIPAGAA